MNARERLVEEMARAGIDDEVWDNLSEEDQDGIMHQADMELQVVLDAIERGEVVGCCPDERHVDLGGGRLNSITEGYKIFIRPEFKSGNKTLQSPDSH